MGKEEKRDRYPFFCVYLLGQAQSNHSTPMHASRCISSELSNTYCPDLIYSKHIKIYINSSASAFGYGTTMKISLSMFQHLASYLRQGTDLMSPSKLILRAMILSISMHTLLEPSAASALYQWTEGLFHSDLAKLSPQEESWSTHQLRKDLRNPWASMD